MWFIYLACIGQNNSMVKQFQDKPEVVYSQLKEIKDPIELLHEIEQLSKAFPGQTTNLCTLIENETSRTHCLNQNQRPHLWMKSKETKEVREPVESEKIECDQQNHQRCVEEYAAKAAKADAPERAIQICNNIKEEKWRNECIFVVAENSVAKKGPKAYASAVELCKQAGNFANNCHRHLIQQFARKAPDADTTSTWDSIFSAHNAIETTWGWQDQKRMNELQDHLWAEAIGTAFSGVNKITGNTFDVIPQKYHPHINAAAARRLFQLEEANKRSLNEWTEHLNQLLQQRNNKPESRNEQRKFLAVADLWKPNDHTDESINYLATSKRLFSVEPHIDIQICILEAVARKPPIDKSIIQSGLQSDNIEVKRTAQRLLTQL
jgi:hypothetical protein